MLLFRRKPREKDVASDRPGVPSETASAGAAPVEPAPAPTPPEEPPGSSGPPPPHPQPSPHAPTASSTGAKFSRCFVCGSPLDAGACPTCRIAWID